MTNRERPHLDDPYAPDTTTQKTPTITDDAHDGALAGSCTIVHRGVSTLLRNEPGKRIVSVKIDVPPSDKDPLSSAARRLAEETSRTNRPSRKEVEVLAAWYEPSDSTVRIRARIPHSRFTRWRDNTFISVSPTRRVQRVDDRINVSFGDVVQRSVESTPARMLTEQEGRRDRIRTGSMLDGFPGPVTIGMTVLASGLYLLGIPWIPLAIALLLLVTTGMSRAKTTIRKRRGVHIARNDGPMRLENDEAITKDQDTTDAERNARWRNVADVISTNAPDRVDDVTRARMRIEALLQTSNNSVNPIVIESISRVSSGLDGLVSTHGTASSVAVGEERVMLAMRLADGMVRLGEEAEDARLIAFRDAMAGFDATTRWIESRNDQTFRI